MPETPEEKWNRIQQKLQQAILTSYPNPERKGCPGADAILELARRASEGDNLDQDAGWQHVIQCSPCYREFLDARQTLRSARSDANT
jgi:hypothetical protein